jgi:mannose-6-phosphate isomerase-like protein (cupin superfamily)
MKKKILLLSLLAIGLAACTQKTADTADEQAVTLITTEMIEIKDYGAEPIVFNIEDVTDRNENFRTAFWTGTYVQMTLMVLQPGEDIGLELHTRTDQFIRVEAGEGVVYMGDTEENLDFEQPIKEDFAVFIPANKWHNLKNTGDEPLKLYSIYAPVEHAHGTIHKTREEGLQHDQDH